MVVLGLIVASYAPRPAHRCLCISGHGELYTAAFGQRVVGQAFQCTVLLGVDLEEAQVPLAIEVALSSGRRAGDVASAFNVNSINSILLVRIKLQATRKVLKTANFLKGIRFETF